MINVYHYDDPKVRLVQIAEGHYLSPKDYADLEKDLSDYFYYVFPDTEYIPRKIKIPLPPTPKRGKPKKAKRPKVIETPKETKYCEHCKKELDIEVGKRWRKYCNDHCMKEHYKEEGRKKRMIDKKFSPKFSFNEAETYNGMKKIEHELDDCSSECLLDMFGDIE